MFAKSAPAKPLVACAIESKSIESASLTYFV